MINHVYRIVRHGLKVRLNYARNIRKLRQLRRRLNREDPERKLIAVMLLEHFGDIVACEPVVRYLREKYPNACIVWGVKQTYRELIDRNPLIDSTLIVHCLSERLMLENTGVFDEMIDLHFSDRYCSLCRKPLMKERGTSDINLTNYFHHGSLLTAMSLSAGLPPLDEAPNITIPEEAVKKIDALGLPSEFIAVNGTSNAEEKSWPKDRWNELANLIAGKLGMPVVEVGLVSCIADSAKERYINLCGKLSIFESAEAIQRAKLFVGIDSGPAHLANAVGTPGVIIVGNYLGFKRYLPYSGFYGRGEGASIIYADGLAANVSIEEVFTAVERMNNLSRKGLFNEISHSVARW